MQYGKSKTMLRNLKYVQCLNIAPMEKAWFRPQWNIPHGLQPQWKRYGFIKDCFSKC